MPVASSAANSTSNQGGIRWDTANLLAYRSLSRSWCHDEWLWGPPRHFDQLYSSNVGFEYCHSLLRQVFVVPDEFRSLPVGEHRFRVRTRFGSSVAIPVFRVVVAGTVAARDGRARA
ncbi:hypothetical protein GCM10027444_19620 [Actinopolyspora lacussalsi]